jgi:flagellar biosynthesis protein FlhF
MVVTKLDIARRLGSVLSAVYRTDVSLCGMSESPLIAEGLIALTPPDLADRLLAVDGKELPSWPKTEVA